MTIELVETFDFLNTEVEDTETQSPAIPVSEGEDIDFRYTNLSYSSINMLQSCPREFQLYRLNAEVGERDLSTVVTFAFGTAVGDAVQNLFITKDLEATIFKLFCSWPCDFFAESPKHKKSLAYAIAAIEQLYSHMDSLGFMNEYTVLEYNGRPAQELGFRILLDERVHDKLVQFNLRGYMDLAVHDSTNNESTVIEVKTSSAKYLHPASYKNSAQALSYSVVLDKIEQGTSSYMVKYLVYLTELERWEIMEFPKTYHQRAILLRDVMLTVGEIKQYVEQIGNYGNWPMRGGSCYKYGKPCQFFDICELPTNRIMKPLKQIHIDTEENKPYDFVLKLEELLALEGDEN